MSNKPSTSCFSKHMKTRYPAFYKFMVIFFGQDYDIFGKTEEDVLKSYLEFERKEEISSCLDEMERYIRWDSEINLSNDQFMSIFELGYVYEDKFKTSHEWCEHLLSSLKAMSKS